MVTLLNENGFEVKGANSNIEDEAIGFLMNYFKKKKAAAKAEPKEEVKAPVKAEAAPAAKKAPAKRTAAKKTATVKKTTTAKKTTKKAPVKKTVKTSVLTPQNSEELEKAFVKGEQPEKVNGPVHIKDELPVYLL